uniref:Uncharacterized protein n=1 Tax=Siphoviridae sp. ctrpg19 TaxID=2826481 RepID=A0A8S5MKG3_9CAUD|nr:MAG TPA: hypothetical protein [Siphoviridae sp. ctrpg19]
MLLLLLQGSLNLSLVTKSVGLSLYLFRYLLFRSRLKSTLLGYSIYHLPFR